MIRRQVGGIGSPGETLMQARHFLLRSFGTVAFLAMAAIGSAHAAPLLIVGNDEKLLWDDDGKPIVSANGKDTVQIIDLANPESPKVLATLPLKNSVVGPPV